MVTFIFQGQKKWEKAITISKKYSLIENGEKWELTTIAVAEFFRIGPPRLSSWWKKNSISLWLFLLESNAANCQLPSSLLSYFDPVKGFGSTKRLVDKW